MEHALQSPGQRSVTVVRIDVDLPPDSVTFQVHLHKHS
jgi:hypothetical protein